MGARYPNRHGAKLVQLIPAECMIVRVDSYFDRLGATVHVNTPGKVERVGLRYKLYR